MQSPLQIVFPDNVSHKDLVTIQSEVKRLKQVTDVGILASRSLDPGNVMMWVQIAAGGLGAMFTGVTIIQKIIDIIQGQRTLGVTIRLSTGEEISVDNASTEEIKKLIASALKD